MDVPMTAVQEKIWEMLPDDCKPVYARWKNSTNIILVAFTTEFPLLTHTFRGGNKNRNMIKDITGTVTLRDLGCFERALQQEQGGYKPRKDSILFGLGYVLSQQRRLGQKKTLVFPLNMCSIEEHVDPKLTVMTAFYGWWREMCPYDIFEKKYLVFPVIIFDERYCTIVLNPIGAVKKAKMADQAPIMVHFGTGRMAEYITDVVPRIEQILGYFVERYSVKKGYQEFLKEKFAHSHIIIHAMEKRDQDYQMIVMVNTMLQLVERNIADERLIDELRRVASNQDEMVTAVETVRNELQMEVNGAVNADPLSPAAHLLQQRQLVLEEEVKYFERVAERKRKAEEQAMKDAADEKAKKKKPAVKNKKVKTEVKEEMME